MTTRAEGNAKLLQLAAILDTTDALHTERGEPGYRQCVFVHGCGTPACLLGHWAHANPARWRLNTDTLAPRLVVASSGNTLADAEAEFGLTVPESIELLDYDGCNNARTAAEAAAYIRAFVARRGE